MKTNTAKLRLLALLLATGLFGGPLFSQPTNAPRLDPTTGLPEISPAQPGVINPATGLPKTAPFHPVVINPATGLPVSGASKSTPDTALNAAYQTANDVHELISNGRYEEALQRCLALHGQHPTGSSLIPVLNDWIELGRRFPKAKDALLQIRDHDTREFSEGRGYFELFSEVNAINGALHQEDMTYALFKTVERRDPQLAQQCYFVAESQLVQKGEYETCRKYLGDPQFRFETARNFYAMELQSQKHMAEAHQMATQQLAEFNRSRGWTNAPVYSPRDNSAMMIKSAGDRFVGQVRQLIEILVATGGKSDAEAIRDEALTILDDPRLKSSVSDAEQKTGK